jgi:hypothetical protein
MVMNKFRNKSSTQAMKQSKMCVQNIPHSRTILVQNVNVWGVWKYHDIFVKGQSKWSIPQKQKLSFRMHSQLININLQESMVIKHI